MAPRDTLRGLLRTLGWLIGGPLLLVVAVLVAIVLCLAVPPLRAVVVQRGLAYVEQSFGYRVQIARIDRFDPWAVELHGVEVTGPGEEKLGTVGELSLRAEPLALAQGTLHITRARVAHVRARYDLEALLAQPAEPEPPERAPSDFVVRVDLLRVLDAELATPWTGRALTARVEELEGGGSWSKTPRAMLNQAMLRVTADGAELLALRAPKGTWSAAQGGRVALTGSLAGAPFSLNGTLGPLEGSPWFAEEVQLSLRQLGHEALERLGLAEHFDLRSPVSLELRATSQDNNLEAKARLEVARDGAPAVVTLEAKADLARAELALRAEPLVLSQVSPQLPELSIAGALRVAGEYAQKATPLALTWRDVRLDQQPIPDGTAEVVLALPVVNLKSLRFSELRSRLSLRGSYDTERGTGDGKLVLDRMELSALAPLRARGLAGELEGQLAFELREGARLRGQVQLRGTAIAAQGAKIAALSLDSTLGGNAHRPVGKLELALTGVVANDVVLDALRADLELTPETLQGTLTGRGMNAAVESAVSGTRARNGDLVLDAQGKAHALARALSFELGQLRIAGGDISLEQLTVRAGAQSLWARGGLREGGALDVELSLVSIELAQWASLLDKPELRGRVTGNAKVRGTLKQPIAELQLAATGLSVMGEPDAELSLDAEADLARGTLGAKLALRSARDGTNLHVRASLTAPLKKRRAIADALAEGTLTLDGKAHLPASRLLMLGDARISALAGTLDLEAHGKGTLDAPQLTLGLRAGLRLPEHPSAKPETMEATLALEPTDLKLKAAIYDELGKLATLEASTTFEGGSLRSALERLEKDRKLPPFALAGRLHERRLDTMQGVFGYLAGAYQLNLPVRLGAELALKNDGQDLDGNAALRLVIFGDKIDQSCVTGSSSALSLDAQLARGDVLVTVASQGDAAGSARIEAKTHLEIASLLAGKELDLPRVQVGLTTRQIELSKLPGLCALRSGKADLDLHAEVAGGEPLELAGSAALSELRGQRGAPLGARLKLGTRRAGKELLAFVSGQLQVEGKENGQLAFEAPLSGDLSLAPTVALDAPISARVRFDQLPLSGPMSAVQALGQVSGTASADLQLTGSLKVPRPKGFVELHDVGFSIAALAQPVRHLHGRIAIDDRKLTLQNLTAKDGDGDVKLSGEARLDDQGTGKARVHLTTDRFPLRQEGNVVGELTLDTKVTAELVALRELSVDIDIHRGRLWLTGGKGRDVQALDPNPDIVFEDAPPEVQEDAAGGGGASELALTRLTIQSHREMWIMHDDFSVQVALDLTLSEGEEGAVMRGDAEITRGELQILGKTFKIQKGVIHFTGDVPPDPDLNLKATYQPPSSQPLHVRVTGLASAPVLTFTGAATNMGEAVALLSGVGRAKSSSSQSAQDDVSNFATTLTAGLLSVAARRKFGDWVPTLGVETNASGQVSGARAGFDASDIIPKFMRGFARGAYVEGIVGGASQSQGGSVGVGVRLDLSLPRDFVTSMGYGPGTRWSADLLWAP